MVCYSYLNYWGIETFNMFGIECIDEIYEVFHARYDIQTNK